MASLREAIEMTHWALTLTLKPKWYMYKPKQQVERIIKHTLFRNATCVVELTKKMNVHLHCYIKTHLHHTEEEVRLFFADKLRDSKLYGFYDLKPLLEPKDIEGWKEYMFKNIDSTIRLIGYGHIQDDHKICSCNHGLICLPYKSIIPM